MTDKPLTPVKPVNPTNSEELKSLLVKNVSLMNLLIPKLKDFDVICEDVLKRLQLDTSTSLNNSEEPLKIKYDLDTRIIAEKKDNVIVIQPQYFMDKDKSELEFILAHEVGHHRYPTWLKASQFIPFIGCSVLSFRFGFSTIPTITLCGAMIASTIMAKRFEESWCDQFAAKQMGVEGGIKHFSFLNEKYQMLSLFQKLWHYDWAHPSLASRLRVLENLRNTQETSQ